MPHETLIPAPDNTNIFLRFSNIPATEEMASEKLVDVDTECKLKGGALGLFFPFCLLEGFRELLEDCILIVDETNDLC